MATININVKACKSVLCSDGQKIMFAQTYDDMCNNKGSSVVVYGDADILSYCTALYASDSCASGNYAEKGYYYCVDGSGKIIASYYWDGNENLIPESC